MCAAFTTCAPLRQFRADVLREFLRRIADLYASKELRIILK